MKHTLISVLTFAAGAALLPAQETQQRPDRPELRERADQNGDGRVGPRERAAARSEVRQAFRERVVDGWTAEWRRFAELHGDAAAAIRTEVDTDHNGVIERDEHRAAMAKVQQWRKEHLQDEWKDFQADHAEAAEKLRGAIDQDGDGKIGPAEAAAAHEKMQAMRQERREHWQEFVAKHPEALERFKEKADKNGDGKVGPKELRGAREHAQERRAERREEGPRPAPRPAPRPVKKNG